MKFTLLAIRHGETLHNKESIVQGQLDVPLSPTGEQQAARLGQIFRQYEISKLWSSDLQRALTTTKIALKSSGKEYTFETNPLLRERFFGEAQGKPMADVRKQAADEGKTLPQFTPPGAETPQQFRSRVTSFFQELCDHCQRARVSNGSMNNGETSDNGPILAIVCHGGWLRDFFTYLVQDLQCVVPGGITEVTRITPNTAVSKFVVNLTANSTTPTVICQALHDTTHLSQDLFSASGAL